MSRKKILVLVLVLVIAVVILIALIFILNVANSKKSTTNFSGFFTATPTPINLSFAPKVYKDENNQYELLYPSNWQQRSSNSEIGSLSSFIFEENGIQYAFTVSPPSNVIPEKSLASVDKVLSKEVVISGKHFVEETYIANGNPFRIIAFPNEENFVYDSFSIDLPPTNTEKYINTFDQIVSHIQIPQDAGQIIPSNN